MDLLIVIIVIAFVLNSAAKKKLNAGTTNRTRSGDQPADAAQSKKPSAQRVTKAAHGHAGSAHTHTKPTTMQPSEGMAQTYEPLHAQVGQRIQSRMESMEGHGSAQGSLGVDSSEGLDLCDADLGHIRELEFSWNEPVYATDTGVVPELDAQAMARAVVMSEILKRPSERKWGRL